jgi:two-component system chemotaxis response regulator CheB
MSSSSKSYIEQISQNEFYLHPEGLFVGQGNVSITTLLGSCVGVAIVDPIQKIGGLNHYLLPNPLFGETTGNRFGIFAIPQLVINLEIMGARRSNLKAKIYGGSSLLADASSNIEVGKYNIELAKKILKELKIPILEENVGGQTGRRICLNLENFNVEHFFV